MLRLEGDAFRVAADQWLFDGRRAKDIPPAKDIWRLVDKLEQERQSTTNVTRFSLTYSLAIWALSESGGPVDYEKLVGIYNNISPDSPLRTLLFDSMSAFWIQLELGKLAKEANPLLISASGAETPLPDFLQAAPSELQEAWRTYRAATAKLADTPWTAETSRTTSGTPDRKSFNELLGKILQGNSNDGCETLLRSPSSSLAEGARDGSFGSTTALRRRVPGSGSDVRVGGDSRTVARALFMCLLKQHRYDLALATMLASGDASSYPSGSERTEKDWQRRYIVLCGLDWEVLYAGGAAETSLSPFLQPLARDGSARAARYVAAMAKLPNLTDRYSYVFAVATFISPSGISSGYNRFSSSEILRRSKEPIPDDLQFRLVQILCDEARPDAEKRTQEAVSYALVRLCRPETKDALRRLLASPYAEVQERAGCALKALGELDTLPKVPPPVLFRVLVDSKPWAKKSVEWSLSGTNKMAKISSRPLTDDNGYLRLNHDYFVDPKDPVASFMVSTPRLKKIEDTWFIVNTEPPLDLTQPTELRVTTSALTLHILLPQQGAAPPDIRGILRLQAERPTLHFAFFDRISENIETTVPGNIVFRSLQIGRYVVELLVPGMSRWRSDPIVLTEKPAEVTVQLQAGADLKFEIVAPGGENRDTSVQFEILCDGKKLESYRYYDSSNRTFRGLPQGDYILRILSSSEKRDRVKQESRTKPNFPEYLGEERSFHIDANTPVLLDVGVIQLKSAN